MSYKNIPWDRENSRFELVIYFFVDEARTKKVKRNFFSKVMGKPEPLDSFVRLRSKALVWRTQGVAPCCYGYESALIYSNHDKSFPKSPIVSFDTHGREISTPPKSPQP